MSKYNQEWDEGYFAYVNFRPISSNPYPTGSKKYEAWMSGWMHAADSYINAGSIRRMK